MRTFHSNFMNSPFVVDFFADDFGKLFSDVLGEAPDRTQLPTLTFQPVYEISESDQGYFLTFDVPGILKDDIHVEVKDGNLKIWGERRRPTDQLGTRVGENRFGRFEKVFTVPKEADVEKIQAHHEHGVLHLTLPRAAKAQPKSIKIESGLPSFSNRRGDQDENAKLADLKASEANAST